MRRKKEMANLAGDAHSFHFLKVPVWLFHFVCECFQVVYIKMVYSITTNIFLCELLLLV